MAEEPREERGEELDEPDFADPLKRDPDRDDERMPGLDPMITISPED
jgi:hypothetical protein